MGRALSKEADPFTRPVALHYWIGASPGFSKVAEDVSIGINPYRIPTIVVVDHRGRGLGPGFRKDTRRPGEQEHYKGPLVFRRNILLGLVDLRTLSRFQGGLRHIQKEPESRLSVQ
jgi:hypothetical protein